MTCTKEGPARGAAGLPGKSSFSGEGDPNNSSRPATQARDPAADRTRLQFLARRLHRLGAKPLFHFLDELAHGADLRASLENYASLDPALIAAYGGDRFLPFFAIDRGAAQ
jgi:hypothetical protein